MALRCDGGIIRGLFHHNRRTTLGGQHSGNRRHHVHGAFLCTNEFGTKSTTGLEWSFPGVIHPSALSQARVRREILRQIDIDVSVAGRRFDALLPDAGYRQSASSQASADAFRGR